MSYSIAGAIGIRRTRRCEAVLPSYTERSISVKALPYSDERYICFPSDHTHAFAPD
jgi:hypothetical protein